MAPSSENPAEMIVFLSLGCLGSVRDRECGQESSWCGAPPWCLLGLALGCPLALVLRHCRRVPIHCSLCRLLALVGGILPSQGTEWGRGLHSMPRSYSHSKSYTVTVTPQGVQGQETMDRYQPLPPCMHAQSLSCVWLFATPWTVARQAPLSMGFSQQEYWRVSSHFLLRGIFLTQA